MKALIVGLGSIGKKHVDAIRSIDDTIELYALRSSNESKKYASIVNLYSMNEVNEYAFDFVIISNPTSEHRKSIQELSALKCPLFIEKPIYHFLSIEDEVKYITSNNIITYVACNIRFLESIKYLKRMIDEKKSSYINEVNVYCGTYLPEWRENPNFRKCYSAIPGLGGGVHIDLIHEIDYLYWIFGQPDFTHKIFSNKSSLNILSYDYANYCLEYPTFNANIILNYYRRDSKRFCEVVFDNESVIVDLLKNSVLNSNGEVLFSSTQKIIDTYKDQMMYFINRIKAQKNTFNTISEAYNVLKICLE